MSSVIINVVIFFWSAQVILAPSLWEAVLPNAPMQSSGLKYAEGNSDT